MPRRAAKFFGRCRWRRRWCCRQNGFMAGGNGWERRGGTGGRGRGRCRCRGLRRLKCRKRGKPRRAGEGKRRDVSRDGRRRNVQYSAHLVASDGVSGGVFRKSVQTNEIFF